MRRCSFTLIEVAMSILVFVVALLMLLLFYIQIGQLAGLSYNTTRAFFSAQKMMEIIRDYNLGDVESVFSQYTFDPQEFPVGAAKGVVYVSREDGRDDLLRVNVVICFRSGQRLIGEDQDLDGVVDGGEDVNGNTRLDSPVELTSLYASRY